MHRASRSSRITACAAFLAPAVFATIFPAPNDYPVPTYAAPQTLNLLSRWNPDGSYGWTYSEVDTWGGALGAVNFSAPGSSWRTNRGDYVASLEWDFGANVTLDQFEVTWRARDHSPDNYRILDGAGNVLVSRTDPLRFDGVTFTDNLATPVTTNKLRFEATLDTDGSKPWYHLMELVHIAARPDASQAVPVDGTFNLFRQPYTRVDGFNDGGLWTDDLPWPGNKPPSSAGFTTWRFDQPYNIRGAALPLYDPGWWGRYMANVTIDLSLDGTTWKRVFTDADGQWKFLAEAAPRNQGYAVWDSLFAYGDLNAQYVRLSWGANANVVELDEFLLFGGPVPEPAGLALLGLGGAVLLRRRTRRS